MVRIKAIDGLNLSKRIIAGFMTIILVFLIVATVIFIQFAGTGRQAANVELETEKYANITDVYLNFTTMRLNVYRFVYFSDNSFIMQNRELKAASAEILDQLLGAVKTSAERDMISKLKSDIDQYISAIEGQIVPAHDAHNTTQVNQLINNTAPLGQSIMDTCNALEADHIATMRNTASNEMTKIRFVSILLGVLCLIMIGLSIFMSRYIVGTITAPLREVADEAAKIADGDLTIKSISIQTDDEIGELAKSFNMMLQNIKTLVLQLQEKATKIASSSTELSSMADNVAAGSTETASAVSEIADSVAHASQNNNNIAKAARVAGQQAQAGSEGLGRVVEQMELIKESTETSGAVTLGLNNSAEKITQIVGLISQIADQTNLLALNAAIEAARAGEQGRGFAVVAEEVRKLAEQSADAASEIQILIENIQNESREAVVTMEASSKQVEEGVQVVQEVGQTFEGIIGTVQSLVGEIESLAKMMQEISSSVETVAAASEQQTATVEEVSSTTQILNSMVEEMEDMSNKFRT